MYACVYGEHLIIIFLSIPFRGFFEIVQLFDMKALINTT